MDYLTYLADAGLYIAIRTLDPNLTLSYLATKLDLTRYPIKLLKTGDDRELLRMRKRVASPIVTCGKTKSLMHALVLCDKSATAQKMSVGFAFASMIAGAAIMLLSVKLAAPIFIGSRAIVLFQLFWLLPVFLTTVLCVRNGKKKKKKTKKKKKE